MKFAQLGEIEFDEGVDADAEILREGHEHLECRVLYAAVLVAVEGGATDAEFPGNVVLRQLAALAKKFDVSVKCHGLRVIIVG